MARKRKEISVSDTLTAVLAGVEPPFEVESINVTCKTVNLRCPMHGIVTLNWREGHVYTCTLCEKIAKRAAKGGGLALNLDDCRQKSAEKYGDLYQILSTMTPYRNRRLRILCPKHGIVKASFDKLMEKGCPECVEDGVRDSRRLTFESLHDLLHVKKMSIAEASRVVGLCPKYLYIKCAKLGVAPPRRRRKTVRKVKHVDNPRNTCRN